MTTMDTTLYRGCGNPDCVCATPGPVCAVDMSIPGTRPYCPRCGWHTAAHPTAEHRAAVLRWAAHMLDAQATAHGQSIIDYTDLLRAWAEDEQRFEEGR